MTLLLVARTLIATKGLADDVDIEETSQLRLSRVTNPSWTFVTSGLVT